MLVSSIEKILKPKKWYGRDTHVVLGYSKLGRVKTSSYSITHSTDTILGV